MKLPLFILLVGGLGVAAHAATPTELLAGYRGAAGAGYAASAERGAELYHRKFTHSAKMPSCASCHGETPAATGRHVVTDKAIKPLAPSVNAQRFSDPAKIEKWFGRNCKEVVGRACTAAEKADFIAFVTGGQ